MAWKWAKSKLQGLTFKYIAIYTNDTTFYFHWDEAWDLWEQVELASELNLTYRTLQTGAGNALLFSMLEKKKVVLCDQTNSSVAIDVKIDGSFLEEKSCIKMLGISLSSKMDWSLTLPLLPKLPPRKLDSWFVLWKFFLLRLLLVSINMPGLVLLPVSSTCQRNNKNRYVGWLVTNVLAFGSWMKCLTSFILFYMYYFGICSYKLAEMFSLHHSCGRFTCYSNRSHDFSFTIPRCYKDVYVNSFFPQKARLWKSLLKSRLQKQQLSFMFFYLFLLLDLITPYLAVDA